MKTLKDGDHFLKVQYSYHYFGLIRKPEMENRYCTAYNLLVKVNIYLFVLIFERAKTKYIM